MRLEQIRKDVMSERHRQIISDYRLKLAEGANR